MTGHNLECLCAIALTLTIVTRFAAAAEQTYDPLAVTNEHESQPMDTFVDDSSRNRKIPLRIYLPDSKSPAAVVLFSHGLGGTSKGSAFLGQHWAARGYVGVFLQHPGRDGSVWKDQAL